MAPSREEETDSDEEKGTMSEEKKTADIVQLKMKFRRKTCSLCKCEYVGWGNNAAPFPGRCCDGCNANKVIPARIALIYAGRPPRG